MISKSFFPIIGVPPVSITIIDFSPTINPMFAMSPSFKWFESS